MRVQDGEIDDEMTKVTGKHEHEDNCDGDDEMTRTAPSSKMTTTTPTTAPTTAPTTRSRR
jgi:hypothetical protein